MSLVIQLVVMAVLIAVGWALIVASKATKSDTDPTVKVNNPLLYTGFVVMSLAAFVMPLKYYGFRLLKKNRPI